MDHVLQVNYAGNNLGWSAKCQLLLAEPAQLLYFTSLVHDLDSTATAE